MLSTFGSTYDNVRFYCINKHFVDAERNAHTQTEKERNKRNLDEEKKIEAISFANEFFFLSDSFFLPVLLSLFVYQIQTEHISWCETQNKRRLYDSVKSIVLFFVLNTIWAEAHAVEKKELASIYL